MTRAEFKAQGGTPRGIDVGGTVDCPGDCSNLIHRTWTATDECGNSAECVQLICAGATIPTTTSSTTTTTTTTSSTTTSTTSTSTTTTSTTLPLPTISDTSIIYSTNPIPFLYEVKCPPAAAFCGEVFTQMFYEAIGVRITWTGETNQMYAIHERVIPDTNWNCIAEDIPGILPVCDYPILFENVTGTSAVYKVIQQDNP